MAVMTFRFTQALGDLDDATLDAAEDARCREATRGVTFARGDAGEDFDALRDRLDGVEVELGVGDGARDVLAEDEVLEVRAREHDALLAGEAARFAEIEEALDLRAHAADRLDFAELVDRARDRDALIDG